MGARGPKPKPEYLKLIEGTARPDRKTEELVPQLEGVPERPKWLTGRARKLWERKVQTYEKRGLNIVGCEDMLAQYCALEAKIIDDYYRRKLIPPASLINALKGLACLFYDAPGVQHDRVGSNPKKNEFANNGHRAR